MSDDPNPVDPPVDPPTDDGELEQALAAIRDDPEATHKTLAALKSEAADYRRKLRKAEQELETTRRSSLTDQERAVAEAKAEGRQEAESAAGRRLLEAQLVAAGAGKLHDPKDAMRYLDVDELLELDVDERERELVKRIDELVESKAYLANGNGNGGGDGRVGVRSQGARTAPGGTKPADADGNAWLRKAARGRS